jgi:glutaredoxin 3
VWSQPKQTIIVWSKNGCAFCVNAKNLLKARGLKFEERNVEGGQWNRDQFFEANPETRSFPQVWIDNKHIGGFTDLQKYLA